MFLFFPLRLYVYIQLYGKINILTNITYFTVNQSEKMLASKFSYSLNVLGILLDNSAFVILTLNNIETEVIGPVYNGIGVAVGHTSITRLTKVVRRKSL